MSKQIDDQANIRRLRGLVEPCQKCSGRGYVTKKQTHPREGLIETREQCDCLKSVLPIPVIDDGRLIFEMENNE